MKTILCFGDSNTWGARADCEGRYDEKTRWGSRVRNMLGSDYWVVEEGQNGRTTVWEDPIEHRMAGLSYLWPCMESHHPIDLVIIMLGTNDTKVYFGVNAFNIACRAGRLVDLVQRSDFGPGNTAPKVLLISPIELEESAVFAQLFGESAIEKSKHFAEEFEAVAQRYGCYFLDAAKYAKPDPADGIHLDAAGHAALAEAVVAKIKEIFS